MRTDREKHELIGAVKSVRVEKARFDDQGGQLTERPLLSHTSTFNQDGCLIEQVNRNPDRSEWRTINDYSDSGKVDQFLADYLKRTSASLGFVLVKDGKIFFQKGYGYADAEKKTPVIPDQTLFYASSVSKLVTATTVMQLVEQGKLEPDADVNTYLKRFQLENNYPAPVT